jgi:hypothetical protein
MYCFKTGPEAGTGRDVDPGRSGNRSYYGGSVDESALYHRTVSV